MAATDPYDVLAVSRDASQKDIQAAFRKLAKKLHPDLNPGDAQAQRKFQEVSAAYDLLGDEEKRARFDRGEIDASGAERPQRRYYRDFAEAGGASDGYSQTSGFEDFDDADDILSSFFSRSGRRGFRMGGVDRRYRLEVDFLDAVNGATKRIVLPDGTSLDVVIPPGAEDNQVIRVAGKGEAGAGGGEPGDALIEIAVPTRSSAAKDSTSDSICRSPCPRRCSAGRSSLRRLRDPLLSPSPKDPTPARCCA